MGHSQPSPFSARLRQLREKAGLTQARLAERAGLHLSAVTRFEQGLRSPSLVTAGSLAAALGVRVDDLLAPPGGGQAARPRGRPRKRAGAADRPPPGKGKKPKGK
jgi:transcriptional regulator with XRE-family HTH domain